MTTQMGYPTINAAKSIATHARRKAVANGHQMEPLQPDVSEAAYVAMCWACGRYLALDLFTEEGTQPYGGVVGTRCEGQP